MNFVLSIQIFKKVLDFFVIFYYSIEGSGRKPGLSLSRETGFCAEKPSETFRFCAPPLGRHQIVQYPESQRSPALGFSIDDVIEKGDV